MATKRAADLEPGDFIRLRFQNGRAAARVEVVTHGRMQEVTDHPLGRFGELPAVILELTLARPVRLEIGWPTRSWLTWFAPEEMVELAERRVVAN